MKPGQLIDITLGENLMAQNVIMTSLTIFTIFKVSTKTNL